MNSIKILFFPYLFSIFTLCGMEKDISNEESQYDEKEIDIGALTKSMELEGNIETNYDKEIIDICNINILNKFILQDLQNSRTLNINVNSNEYVFNFNKEKYFSEEKKGINIEKFAVDVRKIFIEGPIKCILRIQQLYSFSEEGLSSNKLENLTLQNLYLVNFNKNILDTLVSLKLLSTDADFFNSHNPAISVNRFTCLQKLCFYEITLKEITFLEICCPKLHKIKFIDCQLTDTKNINLKEIKTLKNLSIYEKNKKTLRTFNMENMPIALENICLEYTDKLEFFNWQHPNKIEEIFFRGNKSTEKKLLNSIAKEAESYLISLNKINTSTCMYERKKNNSTPIKEEVLESPSILKNFTVVKMLYWTY